MVSVPTLQSACLGVGDREVALAAVLWSRLPFLPVPALGCLTPEGARRGPWTRYQGLPFSLSQ